MICSKYIHIYKISNIVSTYSQVCKSKIEKMIVVKSVTNVRRSMSNSQVKNGLNLKEKITKTKKR